METLLENRFRRKEINFERTQLKKNNESSRGHFTSRPRIYISRNK